MNVQVRFLDGVTGGSLTTDRSESSYGIPVFVPDHYTRDYMDFRAYGPGDLSSDPPFMLRGPASAADLERCRAAGFRFAD